MNYQWILVEQAESLYERTGRPLECDADYLSAHIGLKEGEE